MPYTIGENYTTSEIKSYPAAASGTTVTSGTPAWTEGFHNIVVPINTIPNNFSFLALTAFIDPLGTADTRLQGIFNIYNDGILIASIPFNWYIDSALGHCMEQCIPIMPAIKVTANSKISVSATSSVASLNFSQVKIQYVEALDTYTTDLIKCYPYLATGVSPVSSSAAWNWPASWTELVPVNTITFDFDICAINWLYPPAETTALDTRYQGVIQIGVGGAGAEASIISVPVTFLIDTKAEHVPSKQICTLPIPRRVPANSRVAVRVTDSLAAALTWGPIKIQYVEIYVAAPIVEGIASGSGAGLASSAPLINVLGISAVSGAGLASSLGILDIPAQVGGSGSSLASTLALLQVLALAQASGTGLASAIGDAFPPFEVIEGMASGTGAGVASSSALLNVLAQSTASGSGLGSSLAYLDIITQSQGSGIGVGSALGEVFAIIEGLASGGGTGLGTSIGQCVALGQVVGSGKGLSTSTVYLIVPASVLGSGVGESSADSYLVIPASASTSGAGLAETVAQLIALAQALGSGMGESEADSYIIIPALASGEGTGLGDGSAYLIIPASVLGNGIGEASAQVLLDILASALGSGIGLASAEGDVFVIPTIEGIGFGAGMGTGITDAWLVIPNQSIGSGNSCGQSYPYIVVELNGSGLGLGSGQANSLVGSGPLFAGHYSVIGGRHIIVVDV